MDCYRGRKADVTVPPTFDIILVSYRDWSGFRLCSVIAGMVDLTGFFTLGNIFTAHITGNLVVAAAAAVRGGPMNLAQALAAPWTAGGNIRGDLPGESLN